MKILILGGTRFIGLSVLKRCMEQGYDITYLSRKRITETESPKVILGERQDVIYQLKGCSFDVAIDFSAYDSSAVEPPKKRSGVQIHLNFFSLVNTIHKARQKFHSNRCGLYPGKDED